MHRLRVEGAACGDHEEEKTKKEEDFEKEGQKMIEEMHFH